MTDAAWNEMTAWLTRWFAEPWMRAAAVMVATLVVAWVARFLLSRILGRLASRTTGDVDDRIVGALERPIFWSIVLWGVCAAELVGDLPDRVHDLSLALTQTILALVWLLTAFRIFLIVLEGLQRNKHSASWVQTRTLPLIENVGRVILIGIGAYAVLQIWGLDVAPWLASAGIVGIALGFAAKDTLANLFGGFFIIIDAPYRIGDFVILDSGERGEVTKIGLRSTRILTRDDIEVTVPNAQIANAKIINEAGGKWEKSRVRVPVGVAYGSDVDQVKAILMGAAESVELVLKEPAPRVRFRKLGDSSLDFELLGWIAEPWQRGQTVDKLLTEIYNRLNAEGVAIPFPQRTLHLEGPIRIERSAVETD